MNPQVPSTPLGYSILIFSFLIYSNYVTGQLSISEENNPFRHREVLDPRGRYVLEWLVDWEQERVVFNVTVQTRGYVALGLSKKGKMLGADIVIGGVDPEGRSYFSDRHAIGNQEPVEDTKQDWVLHRAWESETTTFLSFSRPFFTCDEHDIDINDDVTKLLWAYGERDNITDYHFQNRGSFTVYLRDPDLTPSVVKEAGRNTDVLPELQRLNSEENVKIWSVRDTFQIPVKRTTYWCNIHKLSLPRKHHIIGFKFHINPEALPHMHHVLIFRCNLPAGINPSLIYEPFLKHPGEECYTQDRPLGLIPIQPCVEVKVGHAIGGKPIFFPNHVGIPVGDTGPNEYYLMQTHYDNVDMRVNVTADIQMDVYYTENVRENDAGILSIGQHIPGSPSIMLPQNTRNHRIYGHCSSSCTETMFPPEGIKVIGALIHSHLAGRRLRLQHFRNNRELEYIFNDDNYDPFHQPIRLRRDEVTVLPGDQLTMRCFYDTTSTNKTTVGGYGTDQEMCKTFMLFYNRLEDYVLCRSELISNEYMRRYLAGTMNVTWDQSQLEYQATFATTPSVIGMTLSEISDSSYVSWDIEQRSSLQRDHIVEPQVSICPSVKEAAIGSLVPFLSDLLPREYVTFPVQATPYEPPQQCSLL